MTTNAAFSEPRLAATYDVFEALRERSDRYRAMREELPAGYSTGAEPVRS